MTIVKTTISIQNNLFQQAEEIAKEMKISRSRFFVLAVEDFIRRYENKALLDELNRVYEDGADPIGQETPQRMKSKYIKTLEGKEW
jgi:predicted transcriptional regulator